ncbi:MAG: glycosyltransferase [Bacteroidales bacterium]|nr:glycosyltransferase [Clostridium sp.]MCM1204386.1 glycosyltransferase [Bacteroidales bacterium]
MEKLISIIIPCYNVEQYLDRCFDSLKKQTLGFERMELIFINDASTDGTLDKLTALETQYPDNIIVINFTENRRQGAARNVALEYASAPYIGYVDSDDWVELSMFEKMVSAIEKYDCDFVECRWDLARDEKHKTPVKKLGRPGFLDLTKPEVKQKFIGVQIGLTALWNKVFKKSFLVENDIFCPEQIRYEDIFFCYLAFLYAKSYYRIDEALYHYFVNPTGTVQRRSQEYQFDKMDIALGFLQTCRERGLAKQDKEAVEWMFLEKYYVYMLWEIFQEFPERSYSCYLQMQKTVQELVPDYKTNPYRAWEENAFDHVMLKLLDYPLDEETFLDLRDEMLKNWLPASSTKKKPLTILFCKWTSICETGIDHGLQKLGHHVDYMTRLFESVDYDKGYLDELVKRLRQKHYDCVFTVNFIPIVSRVCNVLKLPYICWTVDNPCFQLYSETLRNPWNRIFMFDYSQYEKFHPQNPDCIFHMPLACDYEAWNSLVLTDKDWEDYSCDISFIGSTYEEKCKYNQLEGIPDYIRGYVDGLIQAQLNVYGYNFIEDSLTDDFCRQFKEYAGWYPLGEDYTEDTKAIIADTYIGYKCTEQERLLTLQNISAHFHLDLYTLSDVSKLPQAHHRGGADSVTMMPKIFKCSKINLNMTNRPIKTGLPLRVFDIMGAGGFLLTNYQTELPEHFEIGKDLAAYESQEDLLHQIDYYLSHEDIRMEIAKNGQKKIEKLHSYSSRLEKMLKTALAY